MDFQPSEEHQSLRATVRRLFAERCTPEKLSEVEATEDSFHRALWRELGELGILGVSTSEANGGAGLGIEELTLLIEETGYAVAPVPILTSVAISAPAIETFGSSAQKALLREHAQGRRIFTAAGAVDDPTTPSAPRASHEPGRWSLSGACPLVPYATVADTMLVPATAGDREAVFVLDLEHPGVSIEPQRVTSNEARGLVRLDGVSAQPLGDIDHGGQALAFIRARAQLAWCGFATGIATRALEMTAAYTQERRQFGTPIGAFQAVAQRIADAYIDLEAMRLSLARTCYQLAHGQPADRSLAVASYWCAQGVHGVTYACQHLHGGIGVDKTYPLFRYFLHGRQAALALGGAQSRLARLGDLMASGGWAAAE